MAAGCFSYAGVAQVNQGETTISVYEGKRIPLVAYKAMGDVRKFRLSSRPIPVPRDLLSWTLLDVV